MAKQTHKLALLSLTLLCTLAFANLAANTSDLARLVKRAHGNVKALGLDMPRNASRVLVFPLGECSTSDVGSSPLALPAGQVSPYLAGVFALERQDFVEAERSFTAAVALSDARSLSEYGLGAARAGQGKDPLTVWRRSTALNRLLNAGQRCYQAGRSDVAFAYFATALGLMSTDDQEPARITAEFFSDIEDVTRLEQALKLYNAAANKNSAEYHSTMARVYLRLGQLAQAQVYAERLIAATPRDARAWYLASQVAAAQADTLKAQAYVQTAIDLDPGVSDFYVHLGHTYRAEHQTEKAEQMYRRALSVDRDSIWALESLSVLFTESKRYQEARVVAEQAIQREPHKAANYRQLATICAALEAFDCVRSAYRTLVQIVPGDQSIRDSLRKLEGKGGG